MKMYEKSILIDIIETRLLESYSEYSPQGQYNNIFISYLYRYLKDNTYSGKHYKLYSELLNLQSIDNNLTVKENSDRRTYILTTTSDLFSGEFLTALNQILRNYNNYNFIVNSPNRIVIEVYFGWLPPNAGSWLNLLNSETLIDYYIDGITLRPNTHTAYGEPDSGYVCYKIDGIHEYDTIMFLINNNLIFEPEDNVRFTFASLLEELEGSKGATLNRIVESNSPPENAFYELGPYNQNYLSTNNASLIIQVPYKYAISEAYYVFDVGNSVLINPENSQNINDIINWYVSFSDMNYTETIEEKTNSFVGERKNILERSIIITDSNIENIVETVINDNGRGDLQIRINNVLTTVGQVDYESASFTLFDNIDLTFPITITYKSDDLFIYNNVNIDTIDNLINSDTDILTETLTQYILGDFIWITTDSKIIAYAQNLLSSLFQTPITADGIWSDTMSEFVRQFKNGYGVISLFDDDVIDKSTEELMTTMYKNNNVGRDFNDLFNEW